MPGAQQVAGQELRQIDAVEAAGIGAVMGDAAADERLPEEQKRGDRHEFERRALRVAYVGMRQRARHAVAAVPAEIVELAEGEQHDRRAAEQEDEADRAVDAAPRR